MDQETKKYFEELAAEMDEPETIIPKAELAKASNSSHATSKHISIHTPKHMKEDDSSAEGQLTVDVYQTPTHLIIESTIAGVTPDNLDIDIARESVTIRGKREKIERVKENDYLYQECYWGKFARSIILPQEIDPDKSEAKIINGILTIKLPKKEHGHAKKVKVHYN